MEMGYVCTTQLMSMLRFITWSGAAAVDCHQEETELGLSLKGAHPKLMIMTLCIGTKD